MIKKVLRSLMLGSLLVTLTCSNLAGNAEAAAVNTIPNASKVEQGYDSSFYQFLVLHH